MHFNVPCNSKSSWRTSSPNITGGLWERQRFFSDPYPNQGFVCIRLTFHPDVQVILCPFRVKELWDGQYLNNWSKFVCMCFILQTFIKVPFFHGSFGTIKAERHSLWFFIDGQLHTFLPFWCSLRNEWHACNCWILISVARTGFLLMC